jgi:hypothetical protein
MRITSWCDTLIFQLLACAILVLIAAYLLIALHQLHCLALNMVVTTNYVGENRWQWLALKFRHCNFDTKLTSSFVFQV